MTLFVADLISRCQVIAGHFRDLQPEALITQIRDLVTSLPQCMNRADQLVVSEVFDQMLGRLVRVAGLETQPEITKGFVLLATTRPMLTDWQNQWLRIADCCAALFQDCRSYDSRAIEPRVFRMIQTIDTRYADAGLNARAVANAAHLSAWHAARLLKEQTGVSFLTHLHRRRCAAARQLLVETSLSIKEISTAIGYLYPSQFSRHFRSACGMTPHAFRNARATIRKPTPKVTKHKSSRDSHESSSNSSCA